MIEATKLRIDASAEAMQKLRGGYYTPGVLADALVEWSVRSTKDLVLEPSCGDGQFIEALAKAHGGKCKAIGLELFREEAERAKKRGGPNSEIVVSDAFNWYWENLPDKQFDVVVGNPPFIRYQSFPEEHREPAFDLMRKEGLNPSKLTNAWVPFVVLATRALKIGGRLAMVVPAELLQVGYAAELRAYLARKYNKLNIVTFRRLTFAGIQQETVLLMGERTDVDAAKVTFVELGGLEDLSQPFDFEQQQNAKLLDHGKDKWTRYYLSASELRLVKKIELSGISRIKEYASVEVGIVTGQNQFFILSPRQADELGLRKYCVPVIGRSIQIPGISYSERHRKQLETEDSKCLLLRLEDCPLNELSTAARNYVRYGEQQGMHQGFKCRIRKPHWWKIPSFWQPDGFMLRQISDGPRIVANRTSATSTDTVHRVKLKKNLNIDQFAAASVNSLTFAFSEILGRSYGGGILELEPSEATALPIPFDPGIRLPAGKIDGLLRSKRLPDALSVTDSLLLPKLGLSNSEIRTLRNIWEKLSLRRKNRK